MGKSVKKQIINLKKFGKIKWRLGNCYFQIFYSGETINKLPNGYGRSEKYQFDIPPLKVKKEAYNNFYYLKFWKKYSKGFIKKIIGTNIMERHEGYWKNGEPHGECCITLFAEPDLNMDRGYYVNKDGSPIIMEQEIGNFVDGKAHGKIKKYNFILGWNLINYKYGKTGKSEKLKEKDIPNKSLKKIKI